MLDGFQTSGFAIVRRFLDADQTQRLRVAVDTIYAMLADERIAAEPDLAGQFRQWNGVWLHKLPRYLSENNQALSLEYHALLAAVIERTKALCGTLWRFYPKRSYFRRHIGMAKKVPWHVDADAAAIGRRHCVNVWLPLQKVGADLPSLDIVPGSHLTMRKLPLLSNDYRYRDDTFVSSIGAPMTPQLDPGDALMIDQFTLHRTQPIGDERTLRTACEFRFESDSSLEKIRQFAAAPFQPQRTVPWLLRRAAYLAWRLGLRT